MARKAFLFARTRLPIGALAFSVLLLGCTRPSYELKRPWADDADIALELIHLDETTRPALRLRAPSPVVLPLGNLEAGVLTTYVGVAEIPPADATVDLRIGPAGKGGDTRAADCQARWSREDGLLPTWQPCRIEVPNSVRNATLDLRLTGMSGIDVFVASPVLASSRWSHKPPVFIFLIDTVRADRLSAYDPSIPLGTFLDRLAGDAIVFDRALSSSSWTRTAVATLLTGLTPQGHKVLDRFEVLDRKRETLPKILQHRGYETFAWSANPNVLPMWGFGEGFDAFVDAGAFDWLEDKTDGGVVLDMVRKAIEGEGTRPALYYVHLMDAHAPYRPDRRHLDQVLANQRLASSFPAEIEKPEHLRVSDQYLGYLAEIMDLDEQLGGFFDFLRTKDLYERSLILVVSDHGEEFLDHGDVFHGKTLYEEMVWVPAILKLPGNALAGQRVKQPVELTDLMPTILRVLGLPDKPEMDGRMVLPDGGGAGDRDVPHLARLKLDNRDLTSITRMEWKLIIDHRDGERLFNLAQDPHEKKSLLAGAREQASEMRAALDVFLSGRERGWHIRGCGGEQPAVLRFTVAVSSHDLRASMMEEDDSVGAAAASRPVRVTMSLAKRKMKRELFGRLVEDLQRDEDEVLLAKHDMGGVIELFSADGEDLVYAFGTEPARSRGRRIHLDPGVEATRVRGSEAVRCAAPRDRGMPATQAYLRIWYVPGPEELPEAVVDPAVAERLRALGYGKE